MVENTQIEISTKLKDDLEKMATDKNTDIDNVIKLLMIENEEIKKNPSNYYDKTKISAKDNKNKKGEVTSTSYSTAIPKPILNKLGLQKGQVLYWDIDQYKIIITPELIPTPTPEEESIQAGYDILNDYLLNTNRNYEEYMDDIKRALETTDEKDKAIEFLVDKYQRVWSSYPPDEQVGVQRAKEFTNVITYLLDYPLEPYKHEILQAVYEEITKID